MLLTRDETNIKKGMARVYFEGVADDLLFPELDKEQFVYFAQPNALGWNFQYAGVEFASVPIVDTYIDVMLATRTGFIHKIDSMGPALDVKSRFYNAEGLSLNVGDRIFLNIFTDSSTPAYVGPAFQGYITYGGVE